MNIKVLSISIVSVIAFLLSACSQNANEAAVQNAIAFEGGDECHLCGMLIANFEGPKGQAYFDKKPVKFCSTKDLMAYYLDEENTHRVEEIFVHDMAQSHWDKPDDAHLINARQAWFVAGSSKNGAMGPTLATFKSQVAAEFFAKEFGGQVLAFNQITQSALMALPSHGMNAAETNSHHHHHH